MYLFELIRQCSRELSNLQQIETACITAHIVLCPNKSSVAVLNILYCHLDARAIQEARDRASVNPYPDLS